VKPNARIFVEIVETSFRVWGSPNGKRGRSANDIMQHPASNVCRVCSVNKESLFVFSEILVRYCMGSDDEV